MRLSLLFCLVAAVQAVPQSRVQVCSKALDILILMDTTAGFKKDIANLINQGAKLLENIKERFPGSRMGVAEFKDKNVRPFGFEGDYSYSLLCPMTDDPVDFLGGLYSLTETSGGDTPEAHYEAAIYAIVDQEVGWRPLATGDDVGPSRAAKRFTIMITDAQPHAAKDYQKYDPSDDCFSYPWKDFPGWNNLEDWQGKWYDASMTFDYPDAYEWEKAIRGTDMNFLTFITHDDAGAIGAWQWLHSNDFLGTPQFFRTLENYSANFSDVVLDILGGENVGEMCWEETTTTEEPTTTTLEPTTTTEEPTTTTEEPTTTTEEPTTTTEEPTTTTEEPTTTTEEPTTTTEEPTTTTEEPTTTTEEPTTTTEEPTTTTEEPTTTTEEPTTTTEEPTTTTEEPTTTTEEPCRGCCALNGDTVFESLGSVQAGQSYSVKFGGVSSSVKKLVVDVEGVCSKKTCCLDGCACGYTGPEMVVTADSGSGVTVAKFSQIPSGTKRFRVVRA